MDATGKLPSGMVTVAVCAILLMAIVVPVTQSMASTLSDAVDGTNDIGSSDRAVLSRSVEIAVQVPKSLTVKVTVDGSSRGTFASGFYVYSPSACVEIADNGPMMLDMSTGATVQLSDDPTITQTASGLVIASSNETYTFNGNPWVMYSYTEGFPAATHAVSPLPAIVGEGVPMVGVTSAISEDILANVVVYQDGEARGAAGVGYEVGFGTADYGGREVRTVASVTAAGVEDVSKWYVPYEWHTSSGNEIVRTLVSILPVLLAVALIVGLAAWMMPEGGRSRDNVYSIR